MTISPPSALIGWQEPPIRSVPPRVGSSGQEAVELAASAGLLLDPWQRLVLEDSLGERQDGRWAAFEIALIVSRQNGKGSILEARELAGLFLFGEQLILHSAHEFKTAQEAFRRIMFLIQSTPDLDRRVSRVRTSHGEEGVELKSGQRLRFVARSTGSGRGFSGDCVILDEAYNLPDASVDALMPTMSARWNPQLWYTSSAPDKTLAPCDQLGRVRSRGVKGEDASLAYFEWSINPHLDECPRGPEGVIDCAEHDNTEDPAAWAKANPALGIRVSVEHVARERASMGAKGFARERLGVGDWPSDSATEWRVIPQAAWLAVADENSEITGRVAFAIYVANDRSYAAIGAAGRRVDGLLHVEVIDYRAGTKWLPERAKQLELRWNPCGWVVDAGGPAGSVIADLEAVEIENPDNPNEPRKLEIVKPTAREVGHAYGQFVDAVMPEEGEPTMRYLPHPALDVAVAGAATRSLGDAKAWDCRSVSVDVSTLEAVTGAAWGFATRGHLEEKKPPVEPFAIYA